MPWSLRPPRRPDKGAGARWDNAAATATCAEEAASGQTLGFFERLLGVADAREVQAWFGSQSWKGDLVTTIELRWEQGPISSGSRVP
jgi:hypothetical protein